MAIHANSTTVPAARLPGLLPFDPSAATLLSRAQLLDLLGGRAKVEATIEGLITLLDDDDAPGEDLEPCLAGFSGSGNDREGEDEHGSDLDNGEDEEPDLEDGFDGEPNLGSITALDQRRWSKGGGASPDLEKDGWRLPRRERVEHTWPLGAAAQDAAGQLRRITHDGMGADGKLRLVDLSLFEAAAAIGVRGLYA